MAGLTKGVGGIWLWMGGREWISDLRSGPSTRLRLAQDDAGRQFKIRSRRIWGQVLLYWFCIFKDIGLWDNSEARAGGDIYGAVFEA